MRFHRIAIPTLAAALMIAAGCAPKQDPGIAATLNRGQTHEARLYLMENLTEKRSNRAYLLDRLKLGIATMADGYVEAAGPVLNDVYDVLRTQGINADKTVSSVVINEDLKFWKGEPFEQAMGFTYVALHYGTLGQWGNMRAAADNSLFYLRDFGRDPSGRPYSNERLVRRAAEQGDRVLEEGYEPVRSNFTLGYMLSGLASLQLGRDQEAQEQFNHALRFNPYLEPVIERLKGGDYNTIFVVDYGKGPRKVGVGPDRAIADFRPITPSDGNQLEVSIADRKRGVPQTIDFNRIATDLMWNNLEDVRLAKSRIGSLMLGGGALTAYYGARANSEEAMWAGLGLAVAGLTSKAGAHADTRYCELLPQRTYIVPATITSPDQRIRLRVVNHPASELVLTGLGPPEEPEKVQLRYVRLVSGRPMPPQWATSGRIHYSNPYAPKAGAVNLPYILGGDDVRPPTSEVLDSYQRSGYLRDMTLAELQELYRAEGIETDTAPQRQPGRHVLLGGRSLATPLPGTTGYARLFGQRHPPYEPRTEMVRDLAREIQARHDRRLQAAARPEPGSAFDDQLP